MILRRALARFQYGVSMRVLDIASLPTALDAALVTAAPFLFILVAQFTRLASPGHWRAIALSELLKSSAWIRRANDRTIVDFILALPATLNLFVAELEFWVIGRTMNRMKRESEKDFTAPDKRR